MCKLKMSEIRIKDQGAGGDTIPPNSCPPVRMWAYLETGSLQVYLAEKPGPSRNSLEFWREHSLLTDPCVADGGLSAQEPVPLRDSGGCLCTRSPELLSPSRGGHEAALRCPPPATPPPTFPGHGPWPSSQKPPFHQRLRPRDSPSRVAGVCPAPCSPCCIYPPPPPPSLPHLASVLQPLLKQAAQPSRGLGWIECTPRLPVRSPVRAHTGTNQ